MYRSVSNPDARRLLDRGIDDLRRRVAGGKARAEQRRKADQAILRGDYEGAREYLDELAAQKVRHPYEDERYILDAYVDLSTCHFEAAEKKLAEFHRKYDPVLAATKRIKGDPAALGRLIQALQQGSDPALANLGIDQESARAIGVLLRLDPGYAARQKRLTLIERELAARRTMALQTHST